MRPFRSTPPLTKPSHVAQGKGMSLGDEVSLPGSIRQVGWCGIIPLVSQMKYHDMDRSSVAFESLGLCGRRVPALFCGHSRMKFPITATTWVKGIADRFNFISEALHYATQVQPDRSMP
jgi:hypothetical protein